MYTSLRHGYTCDILWFGPRHMFPKHPTRASRPTGTSCAIYANPAAHPLLEAHTPWMTRKAPSSTDDRLAWFEVRAQRACGKVATEIPNWSVRETLLLVVLLVLIFGTMNGDM